MIDQYQAQRPIVESPGWTKNPILLYSIRASQYMVSTIILGLTILVVKELKGQNSITSYAVGLSVISIVYLMSISVIAGVKPGSLILGRFLTAEFVMMILWFIAFIAMAVEFIPVSCAPFTFKYDLGWISYSVDYVRPCKCAKAATAMCALAWLLFAISSFLLMLNIGLHLSSHHTTSSWWQPLGSVGLEVQRVTGLALISSGGNMTDAETAEYLENTAVSDSDVEHLFDEKKIEEEEEIVPYFTELATAVAVNNGADINS